MQVLGAELTSEIDLFVITHKTPHFVLVLTPFFFFITDQNRFTGFGQPSLCIHPALCHRPPCPSIIVFRIITVQSSLSAFPAVPA